MLRKIRIFFAALFFLSITAVFLDFTGVLHVWLGWMVKVQLLPAILSLNVIAIVAVFLLTLLFGRLYCSVICPLGVMQDIVSNLSGRRKGKKMRFGFSKENRWLRIVVLVLFVVALIAGFSWVAALIEPYSAYGRMVNNLLSPLYLWANNLLAYFAERADSYAFYSVDVWMRSGIALAVSVVTFILLAVLAWRGGRTWCNNICPVGTFLGFISRFSLFRMVVDTSKCNGCKVCERSCKSSCINSAEHSIDYSRCVACMNCVDKCKRGAISYKYAGFSKTVTENAENTDAARRSFLAIGGAFVASSLMAQKDKKVDGGLAVLEDKRVPERAVPVVPVGAQSLKSFTQHCTSCQLCVSKCPNDVLRPSQNLERLMQPEMSFERGFCRPSCNICSQVCPNGAIKPIEKEMKSAVKVGTAVWIADNCISYRDGVSCGNCERHCPNGAIKMIECKDKPGAAKIPMVDAERCLGCGACEYVCPARPFSAIFVEGIEVHRTI